MQPETQVGLGYPDSIPDSVASEFERELQSAGIKVELHETTGARAFAGVELLLPTAVTVVIAGLGAGFLQEAGADAYRALSRAFVRLGDAVLGRAYLVRAGRSKPLTTEYSHALSLIVVLGDGWRLKVLLRDSYDAAQLARLLDRLFEQLDAASRGVKTVLFGSASVPLAQGRTLLAAFDEDQDALLLVNPLPESVRPES